MSDASVGVDLEEGRLLFDASLKMLEYGQLPSCRKHITCASTSLP